MGQVNRHLETVAYKDASVAEADFAEHLEHGTITGVTATGRYKTFTTAFGGVPDVVCYEIGTSAPASRLFGTPDAGSFMVKLSSTGTRVLMFQAWGARA